MNIISAMKASNNVEFQAAVKALSPILTDQKVSVAEKRGTINKVVAQLSEKTFNKSFILDSIIAWINVKEDVCKQYANTNLQVQGIIYWLPRMLNHRDKLEKYVNKYRKQYGLKL
jgi:hypothetical protein